MQQLQVNLRFFAMVRERLGESERTILLPSGSRVQDVVEYVQREFADIAPLFRASMLMRNQEYVDPEELLTDGD